MKPKETLNMMLSHKKVKLNKRGLKWILNLNIRINKNKFNINGYFDDNVLTLMDSVGFLITAVKPKHIKRA